MEINTERTKYMKKEIFSKLDVLTADQLKKLTSGALEPGGRAGPTGGGIILTLRSKGHQQL